MKKIVLVLSLLLLVSCGAEEIKHEAKPHEAQIVEAPAPEAKKPEKEEQKVPEKKPEIKKEENPIATSEEKIAPSPEPTTAPIVEEEEKTLCTVSVTCEKLLDKTDKLSEEKVALIPKDGVILNTMQMEFTEGETVFDLLKRCLADNDISLKYREDAIYKSVYVEGIGGLFEKDCGAYSGWMYKVNGVPPTCGISDYKIKEGDVIEFYYSC